MSAPPSPSLPTFRQRAVAIVIPLVLLSITLLLGDAASDATVEYARTDVVFRETGWADESQCADCHEQAEHFSLTGHARTLQRAEDSDSRQILKLLTTSAIGQSESVAVAATAESVSLSRTTESGTLTSQVGWCVGSGTHARTWVSVLPDFMGATDLLEYRWTWFRDGADFAITPAHPETTPPAGIGCVGLQFDGPRAVRCFSCHATRLGSRQDQVDEQHLVAGVMCQRCHGPRGQHVATEGAFVDSRWQFTDRDDSVRRCGQCHRNAEEFTADELQPDNPVLPRFQPVGLTQSACYVQSEMSCTTCHDPHRPLARQDAAGDWQCIQCHQPENAAHTLCGAGEESDCVRCHMPKVRQPDSPLRFTDHWIRVIRKAD